LKKPFTKKCRWSGSRCRPWVQALYTPLPKNCVEIIKPHF
jgi:hypothetical protein